ncbi:MAG: FtsW/RodA/SpoVE family cell cycle protein [Lachnospiraceae bacterium]|nr:FtsW/RodA/SpoVE family cell cycle protein [Lachnospiraceae bacterium]
MEKEDSILLLLVLLLGGFGLAVLYSASSYNGQVRFGDSAWYLKKQLFAMTLGLAVMVGVSHVDYHALKRISGPVYLLSIALSGAVLLFGDAYNGSRRWLSIGPLSFQPAEFAKPAVILLLAGLVDSMHHKHQGAMIAAVFGMVLPIVALVGTNNLSTAVIILGIAVIMIFISNPRYLPFLWMIFAGAIFLGLFLSLESYRLERLAIWRNPQLYVIDSQ